MKTIFLLCLAFQFSSVLYSQCTSLGTSLATSYVSNNSNKGEMFNIVAANTITVHCFDVNLILGSNSSYEIYYKVGSYVGSESNAAAWTLVGSNPSVPCVGFDVPSPMLIPLNIVIPAGQTYAFYITCTDVAPTGGIRYTNNAGYTNIASDANVTIASGIGKAYPFSTNYINRSFNGTLHYSVGNVLPIELSHFSLEPLDHKVKTHWQTISEKDNDYFTLERSSNGLDWEIIHTVDGAGTSQEVIDYSFVDDRPLHGASYYRLSQTDFNGQREYFGVRFLNKEFKINNDYNTLIAYPNPAKNQITLIGSEDELGEISIYSSIGKNITSEALITRTNTQVEIDLSKVKGELILLKAGERSAKVILDR